jgi:hypothetical protein
MDVDPKPHGTVANSVLMPTRHFKLARQIHKPTMKPAPPFNFVQSPLIPVNHLPTSSCVPSRVARSPPPMASYTFFQHLRQFLWERSSSKHSTSPSHTVPLHPHVLSSTFPNNPCSNLPIDNGQKGEGDASGSKGTKVQGGITQLEPISDSDLS